MASRSSPYDYAGYAVKEGRGFIKTWKNRYLVLHKDVITYYESDDLMKEKGSLQILTVEASDDLANGLLIHGTGGRILRMYTETEDQFNGWFEHLKKACTYCNLQARELNGDNQQEATTAALSKDGWLSKCGLKVKNWKKRYFRLRGNVLSYYDTEVAGKRPKGVGKVTGVRLTAAETEFQIFFDKGRLLQVRSETPQEASEWFHVLSSIVEEQTAADQVRASMIGVPVEKTREAAPISMRHSENVVSSVSNNSELFPTTPPSPSPEDNNATRHSIAAPEVATKELTDLVKEKLVVDADREKTKAGGSDDEDEYPYSDIEDFSDLDSEDAYSEQSVDLDAEAVWI